MPSPESGITRREFLNKVSRAAFAGSLAVGTGIIANEAQKGKEGIIKVKVGNFIPLYELHEFQNIGISPYYFNQPLDALFKERYTKLENIEDNLKTNPQDSKDVIGKGKRTDEERIISNLSKNGVPLVFGDVRLNEQKYDDEINVSIASTEIALGAAALFARWKISKKEFPKNHTRRKILKLGLGTAAFYGLSNLTFLVPGFASVFEEPKWAKRLSRIHGIISQMHPEQALILLRNVVMANKLLLTGQHLSKELGRKPTVAFWVGAAHSGIEEFLQLGQDACREVITAYPKSVLDYIIKNNGGTEYFSSALLAYPQKKDNIYKYELVTITDRKLQGSLSL